MNEKEEWEKREVGALWLRGDANKYYSGTIDIDKIPAAQGKLQVVVFKNKHKKEGENTPDLRIYLSKPKSE